MIWESDARQGKVCAFYLIAEELSFCKSSRRAFSGQMFLAKNRNFENC